MSTIQDNRGWFHDADSPFIASGGIPAVPTSSLTLDPFATRGYMYDPSIRTWYGITQDAAAVGPFGGSDGTYWLAIHRDTGGPIAGWTRQDGTHYLFSGNMATRPPDPDGGLVFAGITVASNVISAVALYAPYRFHAPVTMASEVIFYGPVFFGHAGSMNFGSGSKTTFFGAISADPRQTVFLGDGAGVFRESAVPVQAGWFGAVGDGVTDDTAAWARAVQSSVDIAGNGRLYRVENVPITNEIVTVRQARLTATGTNACFALSGTSVLTMVDEFIVETAGTVVDIAADSTVAIYSNDSFFVGLGREGLVRYNTPAGITVTDLIVTGGAFRNSENGIECRAGTMNNVLVENVEFDTLTAPGGVSGGQKVRAVLGELITSCRRFEVRDCYMHDITSPYTESDTNHETQAIQVLGVMDQCVIDGNVIDNVRNGDEIDCEGIYTKVIGTVITNNKLRNAGGRQASISLKAEADNAYVANNTIKVTDSNRNIFGIYSVVDRATIVDNLIEGTTLGGLFVTGVTGGGILDKRIMVAGNVFSNIRGRAAIYVRGQGDRHYFLVNNRIFKVTGENDGAPFGETVFYRNPTDIYGILINASATHLNFHDNYCTINEETNGVCYAAIPSAGFAQSVLVFSNNVGAQAQLGLYASAEVSGLTLNYNDFSLTTTPYDISAAASTRRVFVSEAVSQTEFLNRVTADSFGTTGSAPNANTPSGATAHQLPFYDANNNLLGYIPIYGSPW